MYVVYMGLIKGTTAETGYYNGCSDCSAGIKYPDISCKDINTARRFWSFQTAKYLADRALSDYACVQGYNIVQI